MTTIDLGELTTTDFEPPPLAARRLIRPVALVVVALLALVTGGSARTPPPRGVIPLWSAPLTDSDSLFASGETVLLNRMNQARATLTAYDAATGAQRWTTRAGGNGSYPDQVTSAGVILLPAATAQIRIGVTTTEWTSSTVALDLATGARLWQQDVATVHATGDTVLVAEHDARGQLTRLRLIRQRDGGTIWSRTPGANSLVATSDDAVVTIDGRGVVTVLRWADGSVARTGAVPWTPDRPVDGLTNIVDIVDGVLLLNRSTATGTTSAVYRLDTLARSWHTDDFVGDCGPVLCSTEGGNVVGRDPVTGAERWLLPGKANAFGIGEDRLLVDSPGDDVGFTLVDARTARAIATLGPGRTPWSLGEQSGPLLLLRDNPAPPMHTTVIRIDRTTGAQFTLGALDRQSDDTPNCQVDTRYLICPGRDRFTVTAVG